MTERQRAWLRRLGWTTGIVLLAAAVATIAVRHREVAVQLSAIRSPSPGHVVGLLATIVANLLLTGAFFHLLMRRYGRVGAIEMQSLMVSATLLNYLPLRPGLFGRIAYHRSVNGIAAMDSARTVIHAIALSSGTALLFIAVAAASLRLAMPVQWGIVPPFIMVLALAALLRGKRRVIALAAAVRYLEFLVWAARYWISFGLIGTEITVAEALAFAAVSVVATMVPFVSNGLGLREWAIGLMAPILTPYDLSQGVTAELVNRFAEAAIIVPLGLVGMADIARRTKQAPTIDR